jgi:6-phosphogluconate dehydrogenase
VSQASSLSDLAEKIAGDGPRIAWVMVPSGAPTDAVITELASILGDGDVVIDGGNSFFRDSERHATELAERGIHFVDVGTSGGIWGLEEGYCLMTGGADDDIALLTPVFDALAPSDGWAHVGPVGCGHYAKMVHNGIEYGLMHAYAEGYELLQAVDLDLDAEAAIKVWRHGSVVRSWLLDLTARALAENPTMEGIAPYVSDSGEGRWTVAEAVDLDVPAPVITLALLQRLRSRDAESYGDRLLAAMRNQFGGHAVKREG